MRMHLFDEINYWERWSSLCLDGEMHASISYARDDILFTRKGAQLEQN